ncbi:MAG: hypothetical protein ACKV2T_41275 [Kofleriaceae bacterium]
MIRPPQTSRIPTDLRVWQLTTVADGVALVPPSGIADGVVRIRDLQRPLRSAAEIFARANTPRLSAGAIESLITSEGEYAAFQVQRGVIEGERVLRFVGAVFGDDTYTFVVGLTTIANAEAFETVSRMCVMRCALGLGHRRQRRFRYTPPAQWTETPWGLASRWRPPHDSADRADASSLLGAGARSPAVADVRSAVASEIVVHPAMPAMATELVLEAIRARHGVASMDEVPSPPSPCLARMWRSGNLGVVVLDDGRFRYPLELVGDAYREVFARVVSSVRLVPPVETPPLTDALLHWVE